MNFKDANYYNERINDCIRIATMIVFGLDFLMLAIWLA